MEILGVGPLEIMFILIIALIVMGPQDMVNTGKTIGRFLRRLITSPTWRTVQQTSRELKYLPNRLIREAGVEEEMKEIEKLGKDIEKDLKAKPEFTKELEQAAQEINESLSAWTSPVISEQDIKVLTSTPSAPQIKNSWITPPEKKPIETSAPAPGEETGEIGIQAEHAETQEDDSALVHLSLDGTDEAAIEARSPLASEIKINPDGNNLDSEPLSEESQTIEEEAH